MTTILTVIHIAVCLFLVGIVLLQHGKGAAMGATFGGSSQTMFGTEGPLPLLNKVTTAAAVIFMVTSISLAYISAHRSTSSLMSDVEVPKPTGSGIERAMEQVVPDMPLQPADAPLTPATPAPVTPETSQEVVGESVPFAVPENVETAAQDMKSATEELATTETPVEVDAVVKELQEQQEETAPTQ